jgi:hypothetical protein
MIELEEINGVPDMCVSTASRRDAAKIPVTIDALSLRVWRNALAKDLHRSLTTAPWPTALVGVAWIHLLCFLVCQGIYDSTVIRDLRHPMIWTIELLAVLAYLRVKLGRDWFRSSPAISLVAKLWISFLILSFNVVSLNSLTGFQMSWYKPVWGTLSTFLFASLAWLFTPLFFIPAVGMWLAGLLMVTVPAWSYLIYGVAWWLALCGIAARLTTRESLASD